MRKVVPADVLDLVQYERVRDERRGAVIEAKRHRRVAVGDTVTVLFENRETVLFQIQEMVRAERIVSDARIQEELDAYNALVPEAGFLSATLFIEIPELVRLSPEELRRAVNRFHGVEQALRLELGPHVLPGLFEAGHSKEEKMAAVHYVRFAVPEQALRALEAGAPGRLVVDHPNYRAEAVLAPATLQELRNDLAG